MNMCRLRGAGSMSICIASACKSSGSDAMAASRSLIRIVIRLLHKLWRANICRVYSFAISASFVFSSGLRSYDGAPLASNILTYRSCTFRPPSFCLACLPPDLPLGARSTHGGRTVLLAASCRRARAAIHAAMSTGPQPCRLPSSPLLSSACGGNFEDSFKFLCIAGKGKEQSRLFPQFQPKGERLRRLSLFTWQSALARRSSTALISHKAKASGTASNSTVAARGGVLEPA